jgi:hypothetical protein
MSDREDFLAWVTSDLRHAELALHNGDPAPRRAIWSRDEPVSVLGAWRNALGQHALNDLFTGLGKSFREHTFCELRRSIAARTAGGRWCTGTPTQ